MIMRHGGVLTSALDIGSLAKVSDGYTAGMIDNVCTSVLIERRVNQLAKKPLAGMEFIAPLARLDPIYKEEEEMFKVLCIPPLTPKIAIARLLKIHFFGPIPYRPQTISATRYTRWVFSV